MRLLAAAAVLLAAQVAYAADVSRPYLETAFTAGEVLEYDLSWMKVVGGRGTMKIAPVDGEPNRLRITSTAESNSGFTRFYPIRDFVESVVTRDTFSTVRYEKKLRERKRAKDVVTTVDSKRGVALRRGEEIKVPTPVHDPLSVVYLIRRLPLEPGKKLRVDVLSDKNVYDTEISVLRRETITTAAGTFRTVVVEPRLLGDDQDRHEGKRMTVWFSDDDRRLPVRIRTELRAGAITVSLRSVATTAVSRTAAASPVR